MGRAIVRAMAYGMLLPLTVQAQDGAPRGMVVVEQDSFPMMWVGSCWEDLCSDGMAFFVPWDSLDVPQFTAEAGSVVELVYGRPPARIIVHRKGTDLDQDSTGPVRLPSQPGVYDYMITAVWEEGDVVEGFRVRIKNDNQVSRGRTALNNRLAPPLAARAPENPPRPTASW
jgi:hypothetical protein